MPFDPMDVERYKNIKCSSPRANVPNWMQEKLNQSERELYEDSRGNLHTSRARAIMANVVIEDQNGLNWCHHGAEQDPYDEDMRRHSDEAGGEKG